MDTHMTFAIMVSILGMLIGFGLLFWVSWRKAGDRHEFSLVRMLGLLFGCMLVPKALAFVLMAACYGLWKVWTGIVYLIRPQSEHKSIPDIDQSDILE